MVTIQVSGLEELMHEVAEMVERGRRLSPAMRQAGQIILLSVARNYEEQGRPDRWPGHSPLTRELYTADALDRARQTRAWQKAKEKGRASIEQRYVQRWVTGGKLLVRSGDLRKSIVLGRVTDTSVEVGSSLKYARIHQLGGVIRPQKRRHLYIPVPGGGVLLRKEVRIPARPYLVLQEQDKRDIAHVIKRHLLNQY